MAQASPRIEIRGCKSAIVHLRGHQKVILLPAQAGICSSKAPDFNPGAFVQEAY